jgi:hypothetical protein
MNYVPKNDDLDHLFRRERVGEKVRTVTAFNETWRHKYKVQFRDLLYQLPEGSYNRIGMDVVVSNETWTKQIMITIFMDEGPDLKLFDEASEFPSETLVAQLLILL